MGLCLLLKEYFTSIYNKLYKNKFRICVLGVSGSSKSSIISAVWKDPRPRNSKEINVSQYTTKVIEYYLYDIKGDRKYRKLWDYYYKKCDVLIYCVDLSATQETWDECKFELRQLLRKNGRNMKNMLVLGTKNDKERSVDVNEMIKKLDLTSIFDIEIACYSVSAKKNTNIELIEPWLYEQYKIKYFKY